MSLDNTAGKPAHIENLLEAENGAAQAARRDVAEQPPAATVEGLRQQLIAIQTEINHVVDGVLNGSGFQTPGLLDRLTQLEQTTGMGTGNFTRQAIADSPNLAALQQHV